MRNNRQEPSLQRDPRIWRLGSRTEGANGGTVTATPELERFVERVNVTVTAVESIVHTVKTCLSCRQSGVREADCLT